VKQQLRNLIDAALDSLGAGSDRAYAIDHAKSREHGDLACNVALVMSKPLNRKPRDLAVEIVSALPANDLIAKVDIAGPGFLNFFLNSASQTAVIGEVLAQRSAYGRAAAHSKPGISVEFVSANPTGPLHVGHGRGAAFGSTLASVLEAAGHSVQREYYVNDAGRQMDILAASVWLRYLQLLGEPISVPPGMYVGAYVTRDCAQPLIDRLGAKLSHPADVVLGGLPERPLADEQLEGASEDSRKANDKHKDVYADALVARCKNLLGGDYEELFQFGMKVILDDIRDDLEDFGVRFDSWFSELSLTTGGYVQRAVDTLRSRGHLYEERGALIFRATTFGDDKDRVVVRGNGVPTYFASDLGYLLSKFERGFERCLYIFGADHHGYMPRLRAAAEGLGLDTGRIEILLVQFAVLYRGAEQVKMSTRAGEFVTLRQLRDEVGRDPCRYFYVMRSNDQHLDFDLELAVKQGKDNPVFYAQYAHARICRMLGKTVERGYPAFDGSDDHELQLLSLPQEVALLLMLSRWSETIANAAAQRAPHLIPNYLRELAGLLHSYYDAEPRIEILTDDHALRGARLALCMATGQVISNALNLIGVSAPEQM
jgi:arginyl-tRNA synthetase